MYYRNTGSFPKAKERLGRVLGPAKNEGSEISRWVLTAKGTIEPCRTLRPLRPDAVNFETEKRKRQLYDVIILSKLGDAMT